MYPSCGKDEKSVVMFKERVRSYKLGLRGARGGVGIITQYHSVLKENIHL